MGKQFLYVSLDKDYLSKNSEEMEQEAEREGINEEGKSKRLLFNPDNPDVTIEEIDESDSCMNINCTSEIGYISIIVPLDTEHLISLIELATKKLNKVKTILEATK